MRQHKSNLKTKALLAERAHAMRHCPTASEAALFRLLSAKMRIPLHPITRSGGIRSGFRSSDQSRSEATSAGLVRQRVGVRVGS